MFECSAKGNRSLTGSVTHDQCQFEVKKTWLEPSRNVHRQMGILQKDNNNYPSLAVFYILSMNGLGYQR